MERTTTWNNVGKSVAQCTDLKSVLQESGLSYNVSLKQVQLRPGVIVPHRFATVRDTDSHIYDVVSDKYRVVQNADAFDFVNYMGNEVRFEKAGETSNGMVYIIALLPSVSILGDTFTPHVIFRNGFSGNVKITAAICPLRIICQNQFNFAFKNTQNAITIRHVGNADAKLHEAMKVLRLSADFMTELNAQAERYAAIKLSESEIEFVLDLLFPTHSVNPYALHRLEEVKASFIAAYESPDNRNFHGTGWGIVNAYTDFITHQTPMGKTSTKEENKFITTVFHPAIMNGVLRTLDRVRTH